MGLKHKTCEPLTSTAATTLEHSTSSCGAGVPVEGLILLLRLTYGGLPCLRASQLAEGRGDTVSPASRNRKADVDLFLMIMHVAKLSAIGGTLMSLSSAQPPTLCILCAYPELRHGRFKHAVDIVLHMIFS